MNRKPELSVKKTKLSKHAVERTIERFGCKNEQDAIQFVKGRLGHARYIGEVTGEQGGRVHMYSVNNMGIYVSLDLESIVTVINLDSHGHYFELKDKIVKMYEKEFRKTDRLERSRIKRLEYMKIKVEAEVSALKLRKYKTRSMNVKNECEKLMVHHQNELWKIENELKQYETKKRELARAIATLF